MMSGMAATDLQEACCILDAAWLESSLIKVLREHKRKPADLKNTTNAQLMEVNHQLSASCL
jgi:hypothetical protein